MPAIPFKDLTKLDGRESVSVCAAYMPKKAPERAANFVVLLHECTGIAASVTLRRDDQFADNAKIRRARPDVLAMAYGGFMFTDTIHDAYQPQSPSERPLLHHGGTQGFTGRS